MANGESNHPEPLEDPDDGEDGNSDESHTNHVLHDGNQSQAEQDEHAHDDDDIEVDVSEEVLEEYTALEETMDKINSCLDELEQKNDDLNVKLRALLAASRQDYNELVSARGPEDDQTDMDSQAGGSSVL
ncbi:uncharacterized protein [Diadema setosum]|uniref:uncharacterized protein n=1 Tax=Diadema setosum TaxID=31175 RepID=UPI003B3B3006